MNMITEITKWINDNKEILFSGIGVAIIGWIISIIRSKLKRKKMNDQNQHVSGQSINVTGGIKAGGNVEIKNVINHITKGVSTKDFNRSQSEYKKDKGREKVQEWGNKMKYKNEWDWHLLCQALDAYIDAIKLDPSHQHPWTNIAYVLHLIGETNAANECLSKSYELASPGPRHPGGNYRNVEKAVKSNSYLSGGTVNRPARPTWFTEQCLNRFV